MKTITKKLIPILLTCIMAFALFSNAGVKNVNAASNTVEIKISDYPDGKEFALLGEENFIILLNEERTFTDFYIKTTGSVTIKGNKSLNITGEKDGLRVLSGSLILDEGVDIKIPTSKFYFEGDTFTMNKGSNLYLREFRLRVNEMATLKEGANITVENSPGGEFECFMVNGAAFNSAGNITINNVWYGMTLRSAKNVISGGNINIDCYTHAIEGGDLTISGGNINLKCDTIAITARDLDIIGGNIETQLKSMNGTAHIAPINFDIHNSFNIGENMQVIEPENYKIDKFFDENKTGCNDDLSLFDSEGNVPQRVVMKAKEVEQSGGSGSNSGNDSNNGNGSNGGNGSNNGGNNNGNSNNTRKYSNEWVDGKWYNAEGLCNYEGILSWKCNSTGWWVEDTLGWYPMNQWLKIDGKWYYFLDSGYMDYSEYRDGCYLGSDGAWVEEYYGGHWCSDSTGWWYEDASGWYPAGQWLWIDGKCYYFEANGYLATNKYIDGYWVGSDGAY